MKTSLSARRRGAAGEGGRSAGGRPRGALFVLVVRFDDANDLFVIDCDDDDDGRGGRNPGDCERPFFLAGTSLIGLISNESSPESASAAVSAMADDGIPVATRISLLLSVSIKAALPCLISNTLELGVDVLPMFSMNFKFYHVSRTM